MRLSPKPYWPLYTRLLTGGGGADGRRRRLEELKHSGARPRYGVVHNIEGTEFVPEVSHAGDDVWVLVHLYKHACVPVLTCTREGCDQRAARPH